ncbi:DUF2603 domain-containing protein [Helicobacter turcicus]|uniref:DUF2603 domain-containing protein n=1 Tax=Helicobacter turcicus TaxID=2867412 RepID=A0ABS7JKP4_9HELI|nr:DUF2603 domain-containing protein [Helicobacter turcicus]MBX7489955.1 DUF2603 domain-containing protein [Helicobacter turcicus]MBX7544814.1 DUF2603 domain-containing protein [Helicobacter turcicus]
MATPKPLEAQKHYKTIKETLKHKNMESLNYDSALKKNGIYTLLDSDAQEFYLIPKKTMQAIMCELKDLESDKYLFKLEQEIYKSMPVDFDDVWCIAIKEIKDCKKEPKAVVKHLKKRYPYLFLSFLDQFDTPSKL